MKSIYNFIRKYIIPPPKWQLPVILLTGTIIGLGISLFQISRASSYLSDDPKACINCHIMTPEYTTWQHSSHKSVTVCNDCHVPQDNYFRKMYFKAADGMRHATIFTLRAEPQVIKIGEPGKAVVQENCIRCHEKMLGRVTAITVSGSNYKHGAGGLCWSCHRETPHGRIHSLSSTPNAIVPGLSPVVPEWLMKKENVKNKKDNSK